MEAHVQETMEEEKAVAEVLEGVATQFDLVRFNREHQLVVKNLEIRVLKEHIKTLETVVLAKDRELQDMVWPVLNTLTCQ
jgi:hypothetical protein